MRLSFWLASCIGAALSCGFLAHESCSYSLGIGMGAIAIFLLDLPGFNGTVSYSCRFLLRALHRPFGMPLAMVSRLLTYGKHYLPLRQIFTPSVTMSPSALASFPCRFLLILITSITQVLHRLICGCTDALVHVIRILGFFILICTAVDSHEVITPIGRISKLVNAPFYTLVYLVLIGSMMKSLKVPRRRVKVDGYHRSDGAMRDRAALTTHESSSLCVRLVRSDVVYDLTQCAECFLCMYCAYGVLRAITLMQYDIWALWISQVNDFSRWVWHFAFDAQESPLFFFLILLFGSYVLPWLICFVMCVTMVAFLAQGFFFFIQWQTGSQPGLRIYNWSRPYFRVV